MNKSRKQSFTVITGGKEELERKRHVLFNQPWDFDNNEFDALCECFKLSRYEIFDLLLVRTSHKAKTSYEAAALLATFWQTDVERVLGSKLPSHKLFLNHPDQPLQIALQIFISKTRFEMHRFVTTSKKLAVGGRFKPPVKGGHIK
jgi:hypothetical protein